MIWIFLHEKKKLSRVPPWKAPQYLNSITSKNIINYQSLISKVFRRYLHSLTSTLFLVTHWLTDSLTNITSRASCDAKYFTGWIHPKQPNSPSHEAEAGDGNEIYSSEVNIILYWLFQSPPFPGMWKRITWRRPSLWHAVVLSPRPR